MAASESDTGFPASGTAIADPPGAPIGDHALGELLADQLASMRAPQVVEAINNALRRRQVRYTVTRRTGPKRR